MRAKKALAFGEFGKCKIMKYPAIFFSDGEFVGVEFPDLPGCYSQGDCYKTAVVNASHALYKYLENYPGAVASPRHLADCEGSKTLPMLATVIEPAADDKNTHAFMYNLETKRAVTFPKNQEMLGDKLTAKIKAAAGL